MKIKISNCDYAILATTIITLVVFMTSLPPERIAIEARIPDGDVVVSKSGGILGSITGLLFIGGVSSAIFLTTLLLVPQKKFKIMAFALNIFWLILIAFVWFSRVF